MTEDSLYGHIVSTNFMGAVEEALECPATIYMCLLFPTVGIQTSFRIAL